MQNKKKIGSIALSRAHRKGKKSKIPNKPGVYFFLEDRKILYIGKATSLKDRVKSYFGKDPISTRGPLIAKMVQEANKIKWQETDSVLEALILEATLIKKHQPKYNTKEKSDKSFNFVCITKEKIPRVMVMRGKEIQKQILSYSSVFGPFTNGSQLRGAMKIIRPIFPFLEDKIKNKYVFYRQLNLVPDISTKENIKIYLNNLKKLKLFFEGKKKKVIRDLEKEMFTLAKEQKFERAGEIKRQIFALKHINDVALIKNDYSLGHPMSKWGSELESFRIEAYDIAHMSGKNMVGVMVVVENGEMIKNGYKKFKIRTQKGTNDTGALREILERRFNHSEWKIPELIVVDGGTAQINTTKKVLNKFNLSIPIVSVVKDEKHKPKDIRGHKNIIEKYKKEILLANNEAHRFAISYHKKIRAKKFLK